VLDEVWPLADAVVEHAAGRALEELPEEHFSVLAEPGTVGAGLREIWTRAAETPGVSPQHVIAVLHHRHPRLIPCADATTRRQLWPHLREGDSGLAAVVHRELRANADAFAALERAVADRLDGDRAPTRLRLHDMLLWLAGSLRLPAAVGLGRATAEWARPVSPAAASPGHAP
jgi:hypothetical protein